RLQFAWVRKRADLSPLMISLRPPGTVPLALAELETMPPGDHEGILKSIAFLVALGEGSARPLVTARLTESDLWQRLRLYAALDRLGAPDARQQMVTTLDSAPLQWLPEVAEVLGQLAESQRGVLEGEVARREASPEYPRALAAAAIRLNW